MPTTPITPPPHRFLRSRRGSARCSGRARSNWNGLRWSAIGWRSSRKRNSSRQRWSSRSAVGQHHRRTGAAACLLTVTSAAAISPLRFDTSYAYDLELCLRWCTPAQLGRVCPRALPHPYPSIYTATAYLQPTVDPPGNSTPQPTASLQLQPNPSRPTNVGLQTEDCYLIVSLFSRGLRLSPLPLPLLRSFFPWEFLLL